MANGRAVRWGFLVGAWMWGGTALATTGLVPDFSTPRRYEISSETQVSNVFQMNAEDNLDRRVNAWRVRAITTCALGESTKSIFELRCTLDDIELGASPIATDTADMQLVIDEWDKALTGAVAQLRMTSTGRMQGFDLDGIQLTRNNDRTRQIEEAMRLVMARAFAGFDLELPPKGDDRGKPWRVKASAMMDLPSTTGTAGGLDVTSTVAEIKGDKLIIETTGKGVRGPAVYNSTGQIANAWDLAMYSRATFDLQSRRVITRESVVQGGLTASSVMATGGTARPYIQQIKFDLIPDGQPAPALGPNTVF